MDQTLPKKQTSERRRFQPLLKLAMAGVSTLMTLLVLEAAVRVIHPMGLHATDTYLAPVSEDGAGPGGKAGAMLLVPNSAGRDITADFNVPVQINSHGLRDREVVYEKPPGTYRILALGDSQTFGYGVEAAESWPEVIEQTLNRSGRRAEVINTGVPGTGTAHQLYFLEHQGWKYRPDAVVVGYFFNDVNNNALCYLYEVKDGKLQRRAGTALDQTGDLWKQSQGMRGIYANHAADLTERNPPFLIRHFHLARLLRQSLSNLKVKSAKQRGVERKTAGRELTAHLLGEIGRQCEERGVKCLVLLLPSVRECKVAALQELAKANSDLLTELPKYHTEALDVMPAFRQGDYHPLFFRYDEHFTPTGHQLVAGLALKKLKAMDPKLGERATAAR